MNPPASPAPAFKPVRIVIVGGVAAGMSAATRARRVNESAEITIIERGGFVSFANCGLPYHIAGRIAHEEKLLVATPQRLWDRYRIHIRLHTQATSINRAAKTVTVHNLQTEQVEDLPYDKLILAPGAAPVVPPLAGLNPAAANVFTVRSMEDTRALQSFLAEAKGQGRRAVIIGAGFIGLEMAEALHDRGFSVTLIEKMAQILPPLDPEIAIDIQHALAAHGVQVLTGSGLAAVRTDGAYRVSSIVLENGKEIAADLVILSIGVRPSVQLAQSAGLTLGATGAIAVDRYQRTSDPDIYAAGDAAEVMHAVTGKASRIPLAGPANRHGRTAGEHAASGDAGVPSAAVAGTAIVQVFTLSAGLTGLSESAARAAGISFDTAYVTTGHHAGYYPGAAPLRLKLIYDPGTRRVLGAQAVGRAGVDKRLDVLATILHFHGTLDDLAALDLAYAPQFGSAKDPLHQLAFAAQNQQSGFTPAVAPPDVNGRQLVDVRTHDEFSHGHFPNAIHIPLEKLREQVRHLDASRPTAVCCQGGLRGHIATRILRQSGFADVVNVKGGWELARRLLPPPLAK